MWSRLKLLGPAISTPCYVYDLALVTKNARAFAESAPELVRVLYATMANPRPEMIKAARRAGLGAFVNSHEHLMLARRVGIPANEIVVAGSGHSPFLMETFAKSGADYCADSLSQLLSYSKFTAAGRVGVRVNLGSLLGSRNENDPAPRLGLTVDEVRQALSRCKHVQILHVYVGTNLGAPDVYLSALDQLAKLTREFPQITDLDLGGGFAYPPSVHDGAKMWQRVLSFWEGGRFERQGLRLTIEPGRAIVRSAGVLYATVTDVKERALERFILVDTSATWYPRTFVHNANDHSVAIVDRDEMLGQRSATICGSTTYSGDILARAKLPEVIVGDVLEFRGAGAYCESMHMDFLGVSAPAFWALDEKSLTRLSADQHDCALNRDDEIARPTTCAIA